MIKTVRSIVADEQGQGLAEYGMILGLVALICIGAVTLLGTQIQAVLNTVAAQI